MRNLSAPIQCTLLPQINRESVTVSDEIHPFPSTRYQGSKNKLTDWIWESISDIDFMTVLDAFGGTGSVSHMLKRKNKVVYYNDILKFNYIIGKALIENDTTLLNASDIDFLVKNRTGEYTFIQNNFANIFYTDEENIWLDEVIYNIHQLNNEYKQAIAYFSLFQSCIIKRPYNLFHRANLYLRLSDVKRSFGNKSTWDKPFEDYFRHFAKEANDAIFSNGFRCISYNQNALDIDGDGIDLLYLDTPYISDKGSKTDYLDFYHFLEGIANYKLWPDLLCDKYKHKPIKMQQRSPWVDKNQITVAFEDIIKKFNTSKIVISYRQDGIPSINQLCGLLKKYKSHISVKYSQDYKYALSTKETKEVLIIAT